MTRLCNHQLSWSSTDDRNRAGEFDKLYTIESSADYGYQSTDDGQEKNLNDADEPSQRAVHQSTSTQSITSSTLTSLPTIISTPVNPVINDVSSVRGSAYFSNIVLGHCRRNKNRNLLAWYAGMRHLRCYITIILWLFWFTYIGPYSYYTSSIISTVSSIETLLESQDCKDCQLPTTVIQCWDQCGIFFVCLSICDSVAPDANLSAVAHYGIYSFCTRFCSLLG